MMMTEPGTAQPQTDDMEDDHNDFSHEHEDITSEGDGNSSQRSGLPMQKRRRVTRACDTCRGKKIKCDGKQPCTHCTVYSYDCTYDQPSNRRRNPAPQYIEALENRLARAEALLKTVMPEADLNDPSLGGGTLPPLVEFPSQMPKRETPPKREDNDPMLESMIEGTGSLELDDQGRLDFYGSSSGRVFCERIGRQIGTFTDGWAEFNHMETSLRDQKKSFNSPRSMDTPTDYDATAHLHDLPTKERGAALCEVVLEDALSLLRFFHHPTFWNMFNRIYDTHPSRWTTEEHRYLPVIYSAMALGTLFARTEDSKLHIEGYENTLENGYKYFKAATSMIDMTDIRDLPSLQAVLLLTYFIQSSARLTTCYSYVGAAVYGALRMGMHRKSSENFDCLTNELRKRAFCHIRKMDTYIGGIIGMPILLRDEDIDQEIPLDVDDECIFPDRILPQPEGTISSMTAVIVHYKLMRIMMKIVRYVYPSKPPMNSVPGGPLAVSYAKVVEVEKDLQEWQKNMPMMLRPGSGGNQQLLRQQQQLRMSFAHVQLTLYRPFLHYIVPSANVNIDKRFYACAATCVSIARNTIHIMSEMNRRQLLIGAYWYQMYSTFWAVMTLVFYSVENPESPTAHEYFNDALDGKDMLCHMAKRSNAADRCSVILQQLFTKLPARFQRGRQVSLTPSGSIKKRAAHSQPRVEDDRPVSSSRPSSRPQSGSFGGPQHPKTPSIQAPRARASLAASTFIPRPGSASIDPYGNPQQDLYTPPSSKEHLTQSPSTSPEDFPSPQSNMGYSSNIPDTAASTAATAYGMQPALPDLANLIFSSADPFAYPNQPITTFEDQFGPMGAMGGPFEPVSPPSQLKSNQGAVAEYIQQRSSQSPVQPVHTEYMGQPIGPMLPEDWMTGDWIRSTPVASQNPRAAAATAAAQPTGQQGMTGMPQQQQGQQQQGQGQDGLYGKYTQNVDFNAIFGGGDIGMGNMGTPMWFHNSLI